MRLRVWLWSLGSLVWAAASLLVFEGLVWGWFSDVPAYMGGVATVYGLLCGGAGAVTGLVMAREE